MTRNRKTAQERGVLSEALAAWFLRLKGYRILARRFRSPVGEIDIIARRGGVLAFIEVKARSDTETAATSIGQRQKSRIDRAALMFVQNHPETADLDIRFDAVLFGQGLWPRHIVDAWRPED